MLKFLFNLFFWWYSPGVQLGIALTSSPPKTPFIKISVLASGSVLLDGIPTDKSAIENALKDLKSHEGIVWYYREDADKKVAPEEIMWVIELVAKYKLRITLSSKPDFSDVVDDKGNKHFRSNQ